MSQERLATYLNDHLAGAAAGLELLSGIQAIARDEDWARALYGEIEQDRRTLEELMHRLNIRQSSIRVSTGWLSEKLARLKTRLDDEAGGALQRLELIEALAIGIDGKRALWIALQSAAAHQPRLQSLNYASLIARAEDQRRRVEVRRLEAATEALMLDGRRTTPA